MCGALPCGRLRRDPGELREPLDEVALLVAELGVGAGDRHLGGVPHDPGDPRVRVLDVVDRVLLRPLGGEVDVELDRLVVPARDEVPAGGVDADLVDQLGEEDDVAAALRHRLRLVALLEVDELVDQHLDPLRVVAEHRRRGRQPQHVPVVIGAEHVDRPVEAALELVPQVGDVGGEVEVAAVGRADERAVLVVAVRARPRPDRVLRLVGVEQLERSGDLLLDLLLPPPRVDRDPEVDELALDLART